MYCKKQNQLDQKFSQRVPPAKDRQNALLLAIFGWNGCNCFVNAGTELNIFLRGPWDQILHRKGGEILRYQKAGNGLPTIICRKRNTPHCLYMDKSKNGSVWSTFMEFFLQVCFCISINSKMMPKIANFSFFSLQMSFFRFFGHSKQKSTLVIFL